MKSLFYLRKTVLSQIPHYICMVVYIGLNMEKQLDCSKKYICDDLFTLTFPFSNSSCFVYNSALIVIYPSFCFGNCAGYFGNTLFTCTCFTSIKKKCMFSLPAEQLEFDLKKNKKYKMSFLWLLASKNA